MSEHMMMVGEYILMRNYWREQCLKAIANGCADKANFSASFAAHNANKAVVTMSNCIKYR